MEIGIRGKLLLIIGGVVLAVLVTQTYLQVTSQRTAFEGELKKRTTLMQENLYQRAQTKAETLQRLAEEDIASYNLFGLTNAIQAATFNSTELKYVILIDNSNVIHIHTAKPELQQTLYSQETQSERLAQAESSIGDDSYPRTLVISDNNLESFMEYERPINIGAKPWGKMFLGFSLELLNSKIIESQEENEKNLSKLNIQTLYIAGVILLAAYLLISHLSERLVSPIITLRKFTKELSEGNFSRAHLIRANSADEVGMLTGDFATMARKLDESYQQLANYNQTLAQKVSERTEALNTKNDELHKALDELEESQQQLIHSEKMAALGQLIAGIAHEINTPLGAIQASVGNSSRYLSSFSEHLLPFLQTTSADEQAFLCQLLTKAQYEKRFSTREERQLRRQLIGILETNAVPKAEDLAEMLVDMELCELIVPLMPQLQQPSGFHIVEMAHRLTGIGRNSETIRTAVGRASKVVFALKHFTHHDNSGKMINGNINEGIRTVLILYQNLLKQGCEVIEHFGDLPDIPCYPDELNQVWTNLIHNAIHAMQNKGTLTIETQHLGTQVKIVIADTGAGIPEEVQPRIFDSFYTTKPAGEGSGLGLGICKRIVDKHQGSINFCSEPGSTKFVVTLPTQASLANVEIPTSAIPSSVVD